NALHVLAKRPHGFGVVVDADGRLEGIIDAAGLRHVDRFTAGSELLHCSPHVIRSSEIDWTAGSQLESMVPAMDESDREISTVVDADCRLEGIIDAARLRDVDRFTAVSELLDSSPHVIRASEIDWTDGSQLESLFESMTESRAEFAAVVDDEDRVLGGLTPKS